MTHAGIHETNDMAFPARKPTIGHVLKQARLRRKMSADDVAEACNVSRSRVYQWEASDYVFPKNLTVLSRVLGVSLRRLKAVNHNR